MVLCDSEDKRSKVCAMFLVTMAPIVSWLVSVLLAYVYLLSFFNALMPLDQLSCGEVVRVVPIESHNYLQEKLSEVLVSLPFHLPDVRGLKTFVFVVGATWGTFTALNIKYISLLASSRGRH